MINRAVFLDAYDFFCDGYRLEPKPSCQFLDANHFVDGYRGKCF